MEYILWQATRRRDKTATFRRDFNPVSIPRAVSKQLEKAVVHIHTSQPGQICSERRLQPPASFRAPSERKVFWY